jgi:hypothetical protein
VTIAFSRYRRAEHALYQSGAILASAEQNKPTARDTTYVYTVSPIAAPEIGRYLHRWRDTSTTPN